MNVLLLAACENDVEAISINMDLYTDEHRYQLLVESCKAGSMAVIEYFISDYPHILQSNTLLYSICLHTRPGARYKVIKRIIEAGVKPTTFDLYTATTNNDLSTVYLFLRNGVKDESNTCLQQAILQDNSALFDALWPKDGLVDPKLLRWAISLEHFEMALKLHEIGKIPIVSKDDWPKESENKFLKYKEIIDRTRARAVTKIGSWWIPICYRLKDQDGELIMAKKSWARVEKMYYDSVFRNNMLQM